MLIKLETDIQLGTAWSASYYDWKINLTSNWLEHKLPRNRMNIMKMKTQGFEGQNEEEQDETEDQDKDQDQDWERGL